MIFSSCMVAPISFLRADAQQQKQLKTNKGYFQHFEERPVYSGATQQSIPHKASIIYIWSLKGRFIQFNLDNGHEFIR